MKHTVLLAAAASALCYSGSATAAEVQISVTNPVVELTIMETVMSDPDHATVGAGVSVRASTASEAMRQNAQQMRSVIGKLKALGIDAKDIQTTNFNLNPQYQHRNDSGQPVFLGYDASNQVTVKLRKLDRIGQTLDALANAGATNFFGPNFGLENDEMAKSSGRKLAFSRADAQAREYSAMAGYTGIRLLEVSETYAMSRSYGESGAIMVTASAASDTTPIEPGQVGTNTTLTAKYEMTR